MSPLLMAPVHIDPSCLHPDLLTEVQHVVIAREQLLLHLNQVIGRGRYPLIRRYLSVSALFFLCFLIDEVVFQSWCCTQFFFSVTCIISCVPELVFCREGATSCKYTK